MLFRITDTILIRSHNESGSVIGITQEEQEVIGILYLDKNDVLLIYSDCTGVLVYTDIDDFRHVLEIKIADSYVSFRFRGSDILQKREVILS